MYLIINYCSIYNNIDDRLLTDSKYDCESKKIITVGRIDIQKGLEYLLQIAKKVLDSHPDWQWDVYGDGDEPYKSAIIEQSKELGLEGRLNFMGNRDNIYELYSNYSLYVMTSRFEGLPMVLLEAKCKELPIVSFDINSGPSDIVLEEVNGYLVEPFDVDAMVEKINFLIEHPEVRAGFSAHAYDNIDSFRKEAVMENWKSLIRNTLEKKGG